MDPVHDHLQAHLWDVVVGETAEPAENPKRFVRVDPSDRSHPPDYPFGNPLTFNDLVAEAYGKARFGHNEGGNGTLTTRFALFEGKRNLRSRAQAEALVAGVYAG